MGKHFTQYKQREQNADYISGMMAGLADFDCCSRAVRASTAYQNLGDDHFLKKN